MEQFLVPLEINMLLPVGEIRKSSALGKFKSMVWKFNFEVGSKKPSMPLVDRATILLAMGKITKLISTG